MFRGLSGARLLVETSNRFLPASPSKPQTTKTWLTHTTSANQHHEQTACALRTYVRWSSRPSDHLGVYDIPIEPANTQVRDPVPLMGVANVVPATLQLRCNGVRAHTGPSAVGALSCTFFTSRGGAQPFGPFGSAASPPYHSAK
jgi:hypothetical protein